MTAGRLQEITSPMRSSWTLSSPPEWRPWSTTFTPRDWSWVSTQMLVTRPVRADQDLWALRRSMPEPTLNGTSIIWNTTTATTMVDPLRRDTHPWPRLLWPRIKRSSSPCASGESRNPMNGLLPSPTLGEQLETFLTTGTHSHQF